MGRWWFPTVATTEFRSSKRTAPLCAKSPCCATRQRRASPARPCSGRTRDRPIGSPPQCDASDDEYNCPSKFHGFLLLVPARFRWSGLLIVIQEQRVSIAYPWYRIAVPDQHAAVPPCRPKRKPPIVAGAGEALLPRGPASTSARRLDVRQQRRLWPDNLGQCAPSADLVTPDWNVRRRAADADSADHLVAIDDNRQTA
jgi:hypothetical protein